MSIAHSRLTAQGQISVPASVRRRLGLTAGAVLEWAEVDGNVVVRRSGKHSSEDLHKALFPAPPLPHSLDELKAGVRKRMQKRYARD
jgi:antitoxin PrlF